MSNKQGRSFVLPERLRGVQAIAYLSEVDYLLRGTNLVALQGSVARGDLWYEAALLKKLLYKSKNQHRSSKHFQHLSEVNRCLKLLQQLQLSELLRDLYHLSSHDVVHMPSSASVVMFGSANKLHMPSQQAGIFVLQRLLAACHLITCAVPAAHAAAAQLLAQLSMTYFMPFCLVALAMVARVQVLACQMLMDSIKAYNSLLPLVTALPRQPSPPGACPNLPQMLSCTWSGGVPTLSLIPHTDPPSFAAAAQVFASTHYAHQNAHTPNPSNAVTAASDDVGQKVSRESFMMKQGLGPHTTMSDATAGTKSEAVGKDADVGQGAGQISPGQGARARSRGEDADVGQGAGQASPRQLEGSSLALNTEGKKLLAGGSAGAQALRGSPVSNHVDVQQQLKQLGNPQRASRAALPPVPLAANLTIPKAHVSPQLRTHVQTASDGSRPSQGLLLKADHPAQKLLPEPSHAVGDASTSSKMLIDSPVAGRSAATGSEAVLDSKAAIRHSSSQPQQASCGDSGVTGRQTADASATELLVFEDRQVTTAGEEEEYRVQYKHTLPSTMFGRQAIKQPQPAAGLAESFELQRRQQQAGRASQSKKRPREEQQSAPASLPAKQDTHANLKAWAIHRPRPSHEHQTQRGHRMLPETNTKVSSNSGAQVKASSKRPMPVCTDGGQSGTALPAVTKPTDRTSSRAPWAAAKGPAQPAFIRIGVDKPCTAHRPAQVSFAPGQLGSDQTHNLSTAAAQSQLLASRSTQGKTSQSGPAVSASGTPPIAVSSASPAASCPPAISAATLLSPPVPPISAVQAVDEPDGCAPASQQASDAQRHDILGHAAMPSPATDPQGSETAAAGGEIINHVLNSAANATAAVTPGLTTPAPAVAGDPVRQQHELGVSATAAEASGPGAIVTPIGGLQQSDSGVTASAPRMMLPISRRKRKGQKAAKTEEPVKTQHSWQELLALADQADSATSDHKSASGHEQTAGRSTPRQQMPTADRACGCSSKTEDIMKLLLGKK